MITIQETPTHYLIDGSMNSITQFIDSQPTHWRLVNPAYKVMEWDYTHPLYDTTQVQGYDIVGDDGYVGAAISGKRIHGVWQNATLSIAKENIDLPEIMGRYNGITLV